MSILDETQLSERLQFLNGQTLSAPDLQGIDDLNRKMRWLHNASLHQPGIGAGFAVHGKKGDRQVGIDAGYVIDHIGREAILTHSMVLPVPAVAGAGDGKPSFFALTVSYSKDTALQPVQTPQAMGTAGQSGAVRLREDPVFSWIPLSGDGGEATDQQSKQDIHQSRQILIAQIEVLNSQLNQAPALGQRRNSRPDLGPHIGSGTVPLSRLDIKPAKPISGFGRVLEVTNRGASSGPIRIDTSQAGFLTTPHYTVQIQGERALKLSGTSIPVALELLRVVGASRDHVDVSVLIIPLPPLLGRLTAIDGKSDAGSPSAEIADKDLEDMVKSQWELVWLGVER